MCGVLHFILDSLLFYHIFTLTATSCMNENENTVSDIKSLTYTRRHHIRLFENCPMQFKQVIEWKVKVCEMLMQVFVEHSN